MAEQTELSQEQRKTYWKEFPHKEDGGDLLYHLTGAGKDWKKATETELLYYQYRFSYEDALLSRIVLNLRHKERALDCGCGTGRNSLTLARYFDSVVAFDVSLRFVVANKKRFSINNIHFHTGDLVEFLKHASATDIKKRYDMIFVGGVFMCVSDAEMMAALVLIKGVLSKKGVLLVRDTIMRTDTARITDVKFYRTKKEYEAIFNRANFKLLRIYNGANRNIFYSLFRRLPNYLKEKNKIYGFFLWCIRTTAVFGAIYSIQRSFKRHPFAHQLFYLFEYDD